MTKAELQRIIKKLGAASVCCFECGTKYGIYSVGCSSVWEAKCQVCGSTKKVTEARDFAYFVTGLRSLHLQLAAIPENKQKVPFNE
jgi:hypothetical protein